MWSALIDAWGLLSRLVAQSLPCRSQNGAERRTLSRRAFLLAGIGVDQRLGRRFSSPRPLDRDATS